MGANTSTDTATGGLAATLPPGDGVIDDTAGVVTECIPAGTGARGQGGAGSQPLSNVLPLPPVPERLKK